MESTKSIKYNGFTTKGGNHVWGAALGLAWNELIDKFIEQRIKVNSDNTEVKKIVYNFNESKFSAKQIDNRCIYIKSGVGQQTITEINKECKKKFPQKSFGDLQIQLGPHDIISYAYLLKKLQFVYKFQRSEVNNFLFKNQKVASFHATQKQHKQQINWFYYQNKDQFMISIKSKNPNDQIYFIKDKNIKNIDGAINKVQQYQNKEKNQMKQIDAFQMPVVELDVKRDVKQLLGKQIDNEKLKGYIFGAVYEGIKLKIDEAGAKVENQAVIMMLECCLMGQPQEPKYFILDNDFWVVMKQKKKHPYFCALISNPNDK